jgi:hypothetical protein
MNLRNQTGFEPDVLTAKDRRQRLRATNGT